VISAVRTAAGVRAGQLRAAAVVDRALDAIAAGDGALNAFTEVTAARARAEAAAVDRAVAAGRHAGPLAGVPFGAKNLFDIDGLVTLAGAAIRRSAPAAARDAHLVRRLHAAGAVLIGATNMDEFAFGFTTENSHYGATRNPHDPSRIAGGSSGGSAAAVAAGMVPLALGTDTNGSVRVPAALCGVFGLKPSFGRLSRRGAFPFVGSLDHAGLFARDVADLALAYDVAQGEDREDGAQASRAAEPVSGTLAGGIAGLRLAVATGHFASGARPEAFAAVEIAARAIGVTTRTDWPLAAEARAAAILVTLAEGGSLHLLELRRRAAAYDPLTRDRFLAGALLPAHWLLRAQRARAAARAAALRLFDEADVLLTPAVPHVATPIGQDSIEIDGAAVPLRPNLGLFAAPVSSLGLPALVVPLADPAAADAPGGLPVGVQLVAAPWCEDLLFRVAAALERAGIARCPEPRSMTP
jgi:AtzE family amidohydrolase